MTDNIFTVLGIQTREDCISNTLAYAVNKSAKIREIFLSRICNLESAFDKCTAYTRISTGESGIPDLILLCESRDAAELVVIENKLRADEREDQTERYASEENISVLHQKLCPQLNREKINTTFIFLTLFPDQEPSSPKFLKKQHSDLLLLQNTLSTDILAEKLVLDWLSLVEVFYENSTTDPQDNIYQKLKDDDGLDGSYLYFRTFLSRLTLPNDLVIEGFFRASRQGRRYYGAIFSKKSWHPAEMTEVGGIWTLDPNNVFNIHFEPQFNVLNGVLNIFLHYEVNPYETAAWVKANVPKEQYGGYVKRRERFTNLLEQTGMEKWIFGGGSNQIAKVQLDFRDYSLKNAADDIEKIFQETSKAIDRSLAMIQD